MDWPVTEPKPPAVLPLEDFDDDLREQLGHAHYTDQVLALVMLQLIRDVRHLQKQLGDMQP